MGLGPQGIAVPKGLIFVDMGSAENAAGEFVTNKTSDSLLRNF